MNAGLPCGDILVASWLGAVTLRGGTIRNESGHQCSDLAAEGARAENWCTCLFISFQPPYSHEARTVL